MRSRTLGFVSESSRAWWCPAPTRLFRTACANLSLTEDAKQAGQLRHLGIEDPEAPTFTAEPGPDGLVWERFTTDQQADEINTHWPEANYTPEDL